MSTRCVPVRAELHPQESHEELQTRLGQYAVGAMTSNLIFLGDQLGLYQAMKSLGPCTPEQLAGAAGLAERYVREWLHQQAAARVISTDGSAATFWLTAVQQDVLCNEVGPDASPFYGAGMFACLPALAKACLDDLPRCYRTGEGLPYDAYHADITCGTCRELGVWVRHHLVRKASGLPGLEEQLVQGCAVADVGCGCGEAVLAMAAAFPASSFHGFDISEKALTAARAEAARRGLGNAEFRNPGVAEEGLPGEPTYALVMTHDAIHDMARPDLVMPNVRKALLPEGCWLIGDMAALESPAANIADQPLAPLLYGLSCHM